MVGHIKDIIGVPSTANGATNANMKALVGPNEGWEDHVMRVVELGENGCSPRHSHDWPHINYVLEGEGVLFLDGEELPLKEGSYAFVPSNKLHQYINRGAGNMKFVCIVPSRGHY